MSVINLPLLPLLKAFGHLSDLDMINLSFCSRRTAQLVNTSKRFTSTSNIFYNSYGESQEISIETFNVYDVSKFTIGVEPSSRRELMPNRFIEEMDVQGTIPFHGFVMHSLKLVGCNEVSLGIIFYDTREDFLVLHKALTKHFLDLHVTTPQLELELAPSDILTYPFLKNWKKWDMVTISQFFRRNYVSSEKMRFLLSGSEYTECLNLSGVVEDGFQYSEGFKLNRIDVFPSLWVQMGSIINSTSQEINLDKFPRPTAFQLINLLKLWIAKEKMVNLTSLRLNLHLVNDTEAVCSEFRREVWRGIGFSTFDAATTGEILRVDVVRVRVFLGNSSFSLHVL